MKLRIVPKEVPPAPRRRPRRQRPILLCDAPVRKRLRLISVHLPATARRPLEKMGILPGRQLTLHYNDHKGTVVLEMGGDSFILGRRETRHLKVVETSSPPSS